MKKQKLADDTEKEDLKVYLDIISGDDVAIDIESLVLSGGSKNYKIFSKMLDDFDRHDVMDLNRLVEEREILILEKSSNNSFGLVPIASPTLLLFHDDPYMKVMQAYYAKELPIPPPTIVPPSPMLLPMFNPQEFFLPEELLPP
ncbi:hypothetical protein Tco_0367210 [Tanacetum coccineum]